MQTLVNCKTDDIGLRPILSV